MKHPQLYRGASMALQYGFLLIAALMMVFPLVWMLLVSLKVHLQSYTSLQQMLLSPWTISNYMDIFLADTFGVYMANSFIVAISITLGNIVFCLMCGYVLARKIFPGNQLVLMSVLIVMMIPPYVVMIPLYRMMTALQWINTYQALIVPWLVTPFGVFLMRQYILSLPSDIEEAARIDGASEWYLVFRIVMPLCKPGIVVLGLYVFLASWNSFLFPFILANDTAHRTLPVGLAAFHNKHTIDWAHLMAGASISALPVIGIFIAFHKQIIQGMTAGALKE